MRAYDEPSERGAIRRAAVRWWVTQPTVDLPTLEHLILLCAEGDDLAAARGAVATLMRDGRWRRAQRLSAPRLANRLATAAGRPEWETSLYRAMGWVARRSRVELAWYAAAASLGAATFLLALVMFWPRLRVEVEPLGEAFMRQRLGALQVQPRVGVYDGFGRRLRIAGSVRAEGQSGTRLIGDTVISLQDGRAQFQKLALTELIADSSLGGVSPVTQRIRFRGSGLILGTSSVVHGMVGPLLEGFRVIRASINGQVLDSTLVARLPVGDPLRIELTFSYTTAGTTANYVVGAGPTWLDPATSLVRIAGLPRPVIDAWQTVEFEIPAAVRPGHQHILLLFRAEDSVEHLFSATNWAVGLPIWGDGNDLVSTLTEAQIQQLRQDGLVRFDRYLMRRYATPQAQGALGGHRVERDIESDGVNPTQLVGTAIEIDFFERDR